MMDVVITMGGLGSRFREVGYNVPKYMIEAKGKTLFEWSLMSLKGYEDIVNRYIFIALKDDVSNVKAFIKTQCEKLCIKNYNLIILDKVTDGQATTALLARTYWNYNNSLMIYNIDTYVEPFEMRSEDIKGDGFIPCFEAEGSHWSFVKLDNNDKVVEIKEKERISNHCTLGAYYFKTCRLYEDLYKEFYEGKTVAKEKYVAPMYDYLLSKNGEVCIVDIPSDKVHVLGTPKELQEFINA